MLNTDITYIYIKHYIEALSHFYTGWGLSSEEIIIIII